MVVRAPTLLLVGTVVITQVFRRRYVQHMCERKLITLHPVWKCIVVCAWCEVAGIAVEACASCTHVLRCTTLDSDGFAGSYGIECPDDGIPSKPGVSPNMQPNM